MPRPCVILLSLGHLWLATSTQLDQPTGAIRVPEVDLCIAQIRQLGNTPPTGALDGIVGNAYDALQSIDTMPVLPVRYTRCKTTPDGRYLIPDNVDAIPVLASNMDIMATYYKNFTTWYKSTTKGIDKELNAGWTHNFTGSLFSASIHGSYSKLHQETKQAFYGQKSSMLHTKLKHHAYTLVADITGGLHPGLERRLMDVAASLENDLLLRARYQMEMIVRDYGTHVAYKNSLLSLKISGMLDVRNVFRRGDFTRDFLVRCKENGAQALHARWQSIDLQRMQPEQVEGIVRALNTGA